MPAFVALAHIVANFWLGSSGAQTANNALAFIDSTLRHLGCKMVGLFSRR